MSETLYLLTLCIPLAALLLIFGMKYFAAVQQARALLGQERAYKELAAQVSRVQTETAVVLSLINASLSELSARTASIDQILKQVE